MTNVLEKNGNLHVNSILSAYMAYPLPRLFLVGIDRYIGLLLRSMLLTLMSQRSCVIIISMADAVSNLIGIGPHCQERHNIIPFIMIPSPMGKLSQR